MYNFFYKPQSNTEVFCKQIEVNFEEFCTNISINLSIPNKKARKCGYIFCYGFFLPRTLVIENLEKILCRNLVKLLRMISIIYLEATQLSLDLLRKEQKLLFLDFSIHVNCENWHNLRKKDTIGKISKFSISLDGRTGPKGLGSTRAAGTF